MEQENKAPNPAGFPLGKIQPSKQHGGLHPQELFMVRNMAIAITPDRAGLLRICHLGRQQSPGIGEVLNRHCFVKPGFSSSALIHFGEAQQPPIAAGTVLRAWQRPGTTLPGTPENSGKELPVFSEQVSTSPTSNLFY